jgi:crotonobetainyl-CoA:carnitine CoA-transferase CaiB-like acyl-CoA transferase
MGDGIFSGLRVIDCASWIAGPAAATILSDFGAEVIKLEPPGAGDPWRASSPVPGKTVDYWWQLTSRNKRSLAIDLKAPQGLAFFTACSPRPTSSSPTSPCRCASA